MFTSVNGQLVTDQIAAISAADRGWTLGDGVFETIRVAHGQPLLLARHLDRLTAGAAVLRIAVPPLVELERLIERVLGHNHLIDAVVRVTVSRGLGDRGLMPTPGTAPTVVISAQPFQPYPARWYSDGVRAIVTDVARNERSPLSRIKSMSYADQVVARMAAQVAGVDLSLMCNTTGAIVCADCANVFVLRGRDLVTPPIDAGALPGVARSVVIEHAPTLGLAVYERPIDRSDLLAADEAVLTNVLLEAAPLVMVDDQPIGSDRPGTVARQIRHMYRSAVGLAGANGT